MVARSSMSTARSWEDWDRDDGGGDGDDDGNGDDGDGPFCLQLAL